jgi:hypothetical protein
MALKLTPLRFFEKVKKILANNIANYLVAGSNIALSTSATGEVTITSTGGVGSSNLWFPPDTAHAEDDEFDLVTLDSDWAAYNQDDDAAGTFDTTTAIDFYGTFNSGNALRVSANSTYRPSWLQVQVPARSKYYLITKAYTFPTNVLIWTRLKFTQEDQGNQTNNDGTVGLAITANSSGDPDVDNVLELYMNEPDNDSIKASVWRCEGTSWMQVGGSTDSVASEGQAIEYAAIHKVGSNYHLWVGTESNWIYLSSTTLSFTPARIGFVFQNVNTAPTLVSGADFIRFIETDKFVL